MMDAELSGRARRRRGAGPMGLGLIAGLVAVGLFAFAALIMLLSYADELREDPVIYGTALDTSAVGFAGLNKLLDEIGADVSVDAYPVEGTYADQDLRVYFLTGAITESRFGRIPRDQPSLLILPKWAATPLEEDSPHIVLREKPGLSREGAGALRSLSRELELDLGLFVAEDVRAAVAIQGEPVEVRFMQWIADAPEEEEKPEEGDAADEEDALTEEERAAREKARKEAEEAEREMEELLERFVGTTANFYRREFSGATDENVLYRLPDTQWIVLSDPDLLNNHGIATQDRARVALRVLDMAATRLGVGNGGIVLDDNLRRRDTDQNLVKLMTRPPFLAATLCLLAAGLLVGWQGFNRFGAAEGDGVQSGDDTITSGPAVLARSAGGFIAGAGRIDDVAERYPDVVRRQVIEALGLSVWDARRVDAALSDREELRDIQPRFDEIATNPELTPMTRAARLLRWKEDILK